MLEAELRKPLVKSIDPARNTLLSLAKAATSHLQTEIDENQSQYSQKRTLNYALQQTQSYIENSAKDFNKITKKVK